MKNNAIIDAIETKAIIEPFLASVPDNAVFAQLYIYSLPKDVLPGQKRGSLILTFLYQMVYFERFQAAIVLQVEQYPHFHQMELYR